MSFLTSIEGRSARAIDLFEIDAPKNDFISVSSDITGTSGSRIDAHMWLPMAAKVYQISPNLKDYLVIPVVTVISDIPNTNGDCLEREQILDFNPNYGSCAYHMFKGKPVQYEHQNKVLEHARGVIFDCYVSPLVGYHGNRCKIVQLLGVDKTKDPVNAAKIKSGELNTYSIGARYQQYECSITGRVFKPSQPAGNYTQPNVPTYMLKNGQLVYRKLKNILPFETSMVGTPAFTSALSDTVLDLGSNNYNHFEFGNGF